MMEETQNIKNQNHKTKIWLVFAAGIVLGFILSLSIYFIDRYFFTDHVYFSKTIEHIYHPEKDAEESVSEDVFHKKSKGKTAKVDSIAVDTLAISQGDDSELDESDFMMDDLDGEELVAEDKIIANRRIKVRYAESDSLSKNNSEYFIVEQWNSPIKNKNSYYRSNSMLKIKGIDIANVEIYRLNGEYYLLHNSRYYLLNNNTSFEKLNEVNISHLK